MPVDAFAPPTRHQFKAPVNPLDKTTLVSIFPRKISAFNATIFPGEWHIPAGSVDKPGIITIGPSSWWKEMEEGMPDLEVPVSSLAVAHSIVRDYIIGLYVADMENASPGVFYIQGELSLIEVLKRKDLLERAVAKQRRWYEELISAAGALWVQTQGNPKSVNEDMKLAAKELGKNDLPWMQAAVDMTMQNCPACGSIRNPNYPVCPNCKVVIDKDKAKALNLQFTA